jgi:Fe-S cluster assembly protein SufD
MNALERMLGEFAAQPAPRPGQVAAARQLRAAALPTRRDENWHYANLRALESLPRFAPGAAAGEARTARSLPDPLPGHARLVLQDGRLQPGSAPVGAELPEPWWPASEFEERGDGRFGLVSQLFSAQPLALRITGRQSLEILHCASADAPARYADVAIEIAPGAQLALVERQLGGSAPGASTANPAAAFGCNRLRLRVGKDAQLIHTRLQQAEDTALLFDTAEIHLQERASYRLRDVNAGAASARSTLLVTLAGAGSSVQLLSLSAARDGQRSDAQYTVRHEAPATRSDVVFRGSASDRAHVACTADVQVAPAAPGARVQQSLRGLIDGRGAEVDLRPRLTIDTDDIQASHGATTGRLDDEVLFYLLARGLAPAAARSLLKWAFLSETLRAIEPQALRRAAEQATVARLSDAPAAELLQ